MKQVILTVIGTVVFGAFLSPQAAAVVPSPISIMEEENQTSPQRAEESVPLNPRQIADKLEDDQRRLDFVAHDLKRVQNALQQEKRTLMKNELDDGRSVR